MEIHYTMEYNKFNKKWVIWKNIESDKGCGCYFVFSGTKKECNVKLKELQNG